MANWTELKNAISNIVKTNSKQEITGANLQSVLNNIVNSIGANATFAGVATPTTNPGTPDGSVFYLALTKGIYSNFNSITVSNGLTALIWNNSSWNKQQVLATVDEFGSSTTSVISQNGIKNAYKIIPSKGYFFDRRGVPCKYFSSNNSYQSATGVAIFRLYSGVTFKIKGLYRDTNITNLAFFLDGDKNLLGTSDDIKENTEMNTDDFLSIYPDAKFFAISTCTSYSVLYSDVDLRDNTDYVSYRKLSNHDTRLSNHDTQLSNHDTRLSNHDTQLSNHDTRLNELISELAVPDNYVLKEGYLTKNGTYWVPETYSSIECTLPTCAGAEFFYKGQSVSLSAAISYLERDKDGKIIEAFALGGLSQPVRVKVKNDNTAYIQFTSFYSNSKTPDLLVRPILSNIEIEPQILVPESFDQSLGNVLYKRRWYCCGDSYSEGDYTGAPDASATTFSNGIYSGLKKVYSRFIALRNDMDLKLLAKCGATCGAWKADVEAGTVETPSNTNTFYYAQLPSITSAEDATFDGFITLWFCINDGNRCTLGTLSDESWETYYGALNMAALTLITNFPLAHIGFIISNNASATYQQACRNVALKWAIPYLDMEGNSQIPTVSGKRPLQADEYGITVDSRVATLRWNNNFRVASNNGHPNEKAHLYQSYFIENWLRSL